LEFSEFQKKILDSIFQILSKKVLVFEDKLIIENALNLWVGIVTHKKELMKEFYSYTVTEGGQTYTSGDLILKGLLYCNQERIREDF